MCDSVIQGSARAKPGGPWALAPNFSPLENYMIFYHTNHMLGTLDF